MGIVQQQSRTFFVFFFERLDFGFLTDGRPKKYQNLKTIELTAAVGTMERLRRAIRIELTLGHAHSTTPCFLEQKRYGPRASFRRAVVKPPPVGSCCTHAHVDRRRRLPGLVVMGPRPFSGPVPNLVLVQASITLEPDPAGGVEACVGLVRSESL